jgi:hypothetical protein
MYQASPEYYKKKYPKLSQITDLASSDLSDTIEWALPSFLRILFSTQDIIKMEGSSVEDDNRALKMEKLINFQLQRQQNGFLLFHDWFKLALKENAGIMKCYWEREYEAKHYEVIASEQEFMTISASGMEVIESEPQQDGTIRVVFNKPQKIKNQPAFEVMSLSDLRYSPEATSLDDANFVAQVKWTTVDYLKRKERDGIYQNVDLVVEKAGNQSYSQYQQVRNPSLNYPIREKEKARMPVKMYECYTKIDVNDDNILEDVIVHYAEGVILKVQENTMGRHPFFLVAPMRDPNTIYSSKGFAELVGEIQDIKTALLRQVIYNIAVNNDKQAFVNIDAVVDIHEFIDGKKAVRVNGEPKNAVFWAPMEQLQPQVFTLFEYIDGMKENRTGITRYNQGLDANSLNKTATGISAIMGASTQRLEMIARIIMESGVAPFYRHLIRLNQMFMDDNFTIRVVNEPIEITPDDLTGEIDVIVNAGVGIADKQQRTQSLVQLIGMYPQMIQAGIAAPWHAAYAVGKLVEEFGWKNINDFLFSPQEVQQALSQPKEEEPQNKVSMSLNYKDLPPDGKVQMAGQVGIQLNPMGVVLMEAMNGKGTNGGAVQGMGEGEGSGNDASLPPNMARK